MSLTKLLSFILQSFNDILILEIAHQAMVNFFLMVVRVKRAEVARYEVRKAFHKDQLRRNTKISRCYKIRNIFSKKLTEKLKKNSIYYFQKLKLPIKQRSRKLEADRHDNCQKAKKTRNDQR